MRGEGKDRVEEDTRGGGEQGREGVCCAVCFL